MKTPLSHQGPERVEDASRLQNAEAPTCGLALADSSAKVPERSLVDLSQQGACCGGAYLWTPLPLQTEFLGPGSLHWRQVGAEARKKMTLRNIP